jgi:hypothetical protein
MIEIGHSSRLLLEAPPTYFGYLFRRNYFERTFFTKGLMLGEIDFSHTTEAKQFDDFVCTTYDGARKEINFTPFGCFWGVTGTDKYRTGAGLL